MDLIQPWALWAVPVAALVVVIVAIVVLWRRNSESRGTYAVANSAIIRALPEYVEALRRGMWRTVVLVLLGVAVIAVVAWGAARPVLISSVPQNRDNRDVVLCLDVSGSMAGVDADIIAQFRDFAKQAKGDRLALVIFNSSAVPVFPLTDDDAFIEEQLAAGQRAFTSFSDADLNSFLAGTMNGRGSSLIGDGLATCLRAFDHPELNRARSVVLATDNEAAGKSLYTLTEAGQLATTGKIQIYGLNPYDDAGTNSTEMRSVAEASGGKYYPLDNRGAITEVVGEINKRETARLPGRPRTVQHDDPSVPLALSAVGALALIGLLRRWGR